MSARPPFPAVTALFVSFAAVCAAPFAHAADCTPSTGFSPCIDADPSWPAAGPARFFGITRATTLAPRSYVITMAASYASRPVLLRAQSPDPDGREIRVVGSALDTTLLGALGVTRALELDLALPITVWQTGSGVEGVTSQNGPELTHSVLRDPRLGAAYALFRDTPFAGLSGKAGLHLSLPLGNEAALAGERSVVVSPAVSVEYEYGRLFAGGELGARLRPTAEFGGARLGNQLFGALGAGFMILPHELLTVAAEAWALPTLGSQAHTLPDGTRSDGRLIPAEWLLSLKSRPLRAHDLTFQAGAGTGIPLSSERQTTTSGDASSDHFAGLTSARFRIVLAVRYAFGNAPKR